MPCDRSQFVARSRSAPLGEHARLIPYVLSVLLATTGCQPPRSPPPAPPSPDAVQGQVVDVHGPIAGATVRWQASSIQTTTDERGEFVLPLPPSTSATHSLPRITAAKSGYYIGGSTVQSNVSHSPPLVIHLRPLPQFDNANYRWIAPAPDDRVELACGNCHPAIFAEWQASAHAHSATNPRFTSLLHDVKQDDSPLPPRQRHADPFDWSLARELPHGVAVCASCHAPTEVAGVAAIPSNSAHTESARDNSARADASHADARAIAEAPPPTSVHCDFCHKIADISLDQLGHSHGVFAMRLLRPAAGQLFFGPLDDVDRGDESPLDLQRESRLCASCHEGIMFGVPVYTTFREWQASPAGRAGKQCQSCHMTPTGQMTRLASSEDAIDRPPQTLASHQLFAGGIEAMLRRAISTSVRWERPPARPKSLNATIRIVAEEVGHRVPTGFIDRHLVLRVEASDAAGRAARQLAGPTLPTFAGPNNAGVPGRLFGRVLADPAGQSPAPFWRPGVVEVEDSRLRPGEPIEMRFEFESPPDEPRIEQLRVRLEYRRFWEQVVRAKQWDSPPIIVFERVFAVGGDVNEP